MYRYYDLRRPRFTIAALMITLTAICVWLGYQSNIKHREVAAVTNISRLGGSVIPARCFTEDWRGYARITSDSHGPWRFWSDSAALVDTKHTFLNHIQRDLLSNERDIVQQLSQLPNIRALAIYGTYLRDTDFQKIGTIHTLEQVWVDDATAIESRGAIMIFQLPRLLRLGLRNAGNGLDKKTISQLSHSLVELHLESCKLSNENMVTISKLTNLQRLSLRHNTAVSDQGISLMESNSELRYLDVVGTSVTWAGMRSFCENSSSSNDVLFITVDKEIAPSAAEINALLPSFVISSE